MKSRFKFKIGFFTVIFLICLFICSPRYFPALCLSTAIHELGHIVMARLCKIPMCEFRLGIFGATLTPESSLFSYGNEIILCLGGPLFNFFTAAACMTLFKMPPGSLFIMSSLSLGMLNLFPVDGFDGGKILSALLCRILPLRTAALLCKLISFIFIFSLWCISVYLLIRVGASLSLFVFSVSLFAKIFV